MSLTTFSTSQEAQQAAALMEGYRFELGYHDASQWISLWLERYRPMWIRDAVVEALYQGRYKAYSVRQILELWHKRGQPIRHTTYEFEAAVCREYGGTRLVAIAPTQPLTSPSKSATQQTDSSLEQPPEPAASQHIHRSLSSVSFNLSKSKSELVETGKPLTAQLQNSPAAQTQDSPVIISTATSKITPKITYTRGIQPFKPSLPFSAQTLRLAKQKALATLGPK